MRSTAGDTARQRSHGGVDGGPHRGHGGPRPPLPPLCGNGVCPAGPARKVRIYRLLRNPIPFTDRNTDLPILLQILVYIKYCYLIYIVLPKCVH